MNAPQTFFFFLILSLTANSEALAQTASSERERLSGFAEHQKNLEKFEKARLQGQTAQFEEEEQWEIERERNLREYKRNKKVRVMSDDGPEARADLAEKKAYELEREKTRQEFVARKAKQEVLSREKLGLPSEAQELGLNVDRPRYDYRKRASFGATPKYGQNTPSSSSSGGSRFGGGAVSPTSPSFPPPPSFEPEYQDGYVPAPNLPMDDFGDVPPPPPPPPIFPEQMEEGVPYDFPPPPPPPPPPNFEEGADF